MKTKFIQLFMLPIAAFTLASAAVVSTNSEEEKTSSSTMTAYIHNPTILDCQTVSVECRVGNGPTCLYENQWQAFDKESENSCSILLERVE